MSFEKTEEKVIKWAEERMFFAENGATKEGQLKKLQEELDELKEAVLNNKISDVADGIGDMTVVLTILAEMFHTSVSFCYGFAYNVIRDRKGKMVDGIFVKEQ